jgi:hypothetical protein
VEGISVNLSSVSGSIANAQAMVNDLNEVIAGFDEV